MKSILCALLLSVLARPLIGQGSPTQGSADQPYTMEYYYKVQWGHEQEFLQLFLKNHYPLCRKSESFVTDRDQLEIVAKPSPFLPEPLHTAQDGLR